MSGPAPGAGSWLERFRAAVAQGEPGCPADRLVGARLAHVEPGHAVLRYGFDPAHANPTGVLHGGVVTLLADSAMGTAFLSTLDADQVGTNTGIHVEFLRPTTRGVLEAEGRVVQSGRTSALLEATVRDASGRLVARATSRFLRRPA